MNLRGRLLRKFRRRKRRMLRKKRKGQMLKKMPPKLKMAFTIPTKKASIMPKLKRSRKNHSDFKNSLTKSRLSESKK